MATEGEPTAPTPSAFGRYTLLERLAVGGMAEVFRAKIIVVARLREDPGRQADPAPPRRRPELRLDVHRRGQADRAADASEDRPGAGLRRGARPVLHRAGIHRRLRRAGAAARRRPEAGSHPARAGRVHRQRGAGGAGLRAQRPRHGRQADAHRPPRHLAVEHLHVEARRREAGRLRHRARAAPRIEDAGRDAERANTATCPPSRSSAVPSTRAAICSPSACCSPSC